MSIKLIYAVTADIGLFGIIYGILIAETMRIVHKESQIVAKLNRLSRLSGIALGLFLIGLSINGGAWANNWLGYQTIPILHKIFTHTLFVMFFLIFLIGVRYLTFTDKSFIIFIIGCATLLEGLYSPIHYLIKMAILLVIVAIRVVIIFRSGVSGGDSSRLAK